MSRALFLMFIIFILVLIDIYAYQGMISGLNQNKYIKLWKGIYWSISLFTIVSIIYTLFYFNSGMAHDRKGLYNFLIGFIFSVFVSKLFFSTTMLLQDSGRVLFGAIHYLQSLFKDDKFIPGTFLPSRRQFLTNVSTVAAVIPFISMMYGITKGKYRYTVQKIVLTFQDLPKAFDGFKLVQISDIHAGSFDDKEKVKLGIDKINALQPDIVCFTGDLVNSEKNEIDPYIDIFSEIEARYGKYAVLGNHDYYGHYDRKNPAAEKNYFEDFFAKFKAMGFDLLNNENRNITIDGEVLHLIGVENWGAGHWFPKRGDLNLSTEGLTSNGFKILMSHDPTHWDEIVLDYDKHIHLTLSGHTHGFQFGFQLPGFKWSPAQYRYKKWLGLYQEKGQFLYVNRGFGFLGFPGRVGMWPEITEITLKCSNIDN